MSEHTIKMLYKERAEQAEKIDALTAENAKLRERVAELEAVRVPVMPRPSTGHPAATHRCGICGGVVQFDGTPPNPECWPAGKKRKEPADA